MALDFFVVSSLIMGDKLGTEVAVSVKSASVEAVLKGHMKKVSMYLGKKLSCTQTNIHWEYLGKFSLLEWILHSLKNS